MSIITTLAISTFREAVRARVFLYLLAVGAFIAVAGLPAADLSIGSSQRIALDTSMTAATVVGLFLSLCVASVSDEIEKRTFYTVIAKGASRTQFVIGKYLGVWITVSLAVLA